MSEVGRLSEEEEAFLEPYLPPGRVAPGGSVHASQEHNATEQQVSGTTGEFPFVTMTYATSLDSMISLAPGLRTTLSGPETKSMTHYLRQHHDAILVGVGTAIPDDPGLNSRYPGATLDLQPRPVIVDSQLRWNPQGSKLEQLMNDGSGKKPWLIHSPAGADGKTPCSAICEYICIPGETQQGAMPDQAALQSTTRAIPWPRLLKTLKQNGVNSVMIEGGATIISTLLSMPELVNSVIITIAPTWLGEGGVTVTPAPREHGGDRVNAARLNETVWRQFGADAVLCGRLDV